MSDKQLKDKAISIKGNSYVLVSDRIVYFNETYPKGSISTELISEPQSTLVVVKATILPDYNSPERKFTGYSQAKWGDGMVNKTSALENAETSAVGRALAMMGIGVIDSVASVDEMNKAGSNKPVTIDNSATYPQRKLVSALCKELELDQTDVWNYLGVPEGTKLNKQQASQVIEHLQSMKLGPVDDGMDLINVDEVNDEVPF